LDTILKVDNLGKIQPVWFKLAHGFQKRWTKADTKWGRKLIWPF